jgi:SAM-dependent methyltransferase
LTWLEIDLIRLVVSAARQLAAGGFDLEQLADEVRHGRWLPLREDAASTHQVLCVSPHNEATIVNLARNGYRLRNIARAAIATRLRYPDRTFDLAISNYAMASTPGIALPVAELIRVVKPGGLVAAIETGCDPASLFGAEVHSVVWHHGPEPGRQRIDNSVVVRLRP